MLSLSLFYNLIWSKLSKLYKLIDKFSTKSISSVTTFILLVYTLARVPLVGKRAVNPCLTKCPVESAEQD